MAGAHTSEKRWYRNQNPEGNAAVSESIQTAANVLINAMYDAEQMYGEMLEMYAYTGSTMQGLADQLFKEKWEARQEAQASADEVAMAQDAFDAVTAMHELYQCMTNVTVAQEDRLAQLRRMS